MMHCYCCYFFFQAEDGIRDAQESRGLGDVYKRQVPALKRVFLALDRASNHDQHRRGGTRQLAPDPHGFARDVERLSLIHI